MFDIGIGRTRFVWIADLLRGLDVSDSLLHELGDCRSRGRRFKERQWARGFVLRSLVRFEWRNLHDSTDQPNSCLAPHP